MGTSGAVATREASLGRALRLEYSTVAWNVVEGLIAVTAALAAGSVALLGFGIDSFVDTLLSWWWADPVAALVISVLIAREGLESWRGEECCP